MPTEKELISIHLANKAINAANDGITIADMTLPDQPLVFINHAFEKITGYKNTEVVGKNCRFLQGDLRGQAEQLAIIREAIKNQKNCRVVLKNVRKDGSIFWNELSLAPIKDADGALHYYVGIQKDITNEMIQKEKMLYLAEHDELTGLYNYRGFFHKINILLSDSIESHDFIVTGIVDIDYFKKINDEFGHVVGNNILKMIGSEFIQEFGAQSIIARFGGDEFCFVMTTKNNNPDLFYEKVNRVAHSVNALLTNSAHITMSAGVVIEKTNAGTRIDRLIYLADTAMYENKQLAHLKK